MLVGFKFNACLQLAIAVALVILGVSAGAVAKDEPGHAGDGSHTERVAYELDLTIWRGEQKVASPTLVVESGVPATLQRTDQDGNGLEIQVLAAREKQIGDGHAASVTFDIFELSGTGEDAKAIQVASPAFGVSEAKAADEPVYFSLNDSLDVSFTLKKLTAEGADFDSLSKPCANEREPGKAIAGAVGNEETRPQSDQECCSRSCPDGETGWFCCGALSCCDCGVCCEPPYDPCEFFNCPDTDPY